MKQIPRDKPRSFLLPMVESIAIGKIMEPIWLPLRDQLRDNCDIELYESYL